MTELTEFTDPRDARRALGAEGLLADFNDAGVLHAADIHVARTVRTLTGDDDPHVALAIAAATRAVRLGSVCLDPHTVREVAPEQAWPEAGEWLTAVSDSAAVAAGVLHVDAGLIYLDRYWQQEVQIAGDFDRRLGAPARELSAADHESLDRIFATLAQAYGSDVDEQRAAAVRCLQYSTTVVTGGPGTGKTTAVAGFLAVLAARDAERPLKIALAAPTGKAAARLAAAVTESAARFPEADRQRVEGLEAVTLHRLLGWRPGNSTRFRHDRNNRLSHDVIVVDEASMLSLSMMARLLEALRDGTQLIIVGDPDQLASVEAGAVLADLVAGLATRGTVAALRTNHRAEAQDLVDLAAAVRDGDADRAIDVLRAGHDSIEFLDMDSGADASAQLRTRLLGQALAIRAAAERGDSTEAMAALNRHRLLCAHRAGPAGVSWWNRQVEQWVREETGDPLRADMYLGRPVLVTANDYGLRIFNGDAGVIVAAPERPDGFIDSAPQSRTLAASRLSDVETTYALTVHKSQGSQAREITFVLPDEESRLLTREVLYTAITRAQERVTVVGTEPVIRAAIQRQAQRASGLAQRLQATRSET